MSITLACSIKLERSKIWCHSNPHRHTKRVVWLQAHSGPEVNQSQAICASNINRPAAAIDLFGAQFRSNGLQYCLSEVRQFLPAHSCCKFLEAVQDIEVNLAKTIPTFLVSVKFYQGPLWSTDNFQESAEKVFKWLGHARAHLQSRQELFRKGERAERKCPCWKISMTRFVSPTKIAGLPPHRNPNLTCQTTTRNAQLIAALYFTRLPECSLGFMLRTLTAVLRKAPLSELRFRTQFSSLRLANDKLSAKRSFIINCEPTQMAQFEQL